MINFLIVEPQMAICGNGVVEEGEECDCGWEEDCLEDCCWPQRTKYAANQVHFAHKICKSVHLILSLKKINLF